MSGALQWCRSVLQRPQRACPAWMDDSINFLPYRRTRALRLRRRRRWELAWAACLGVVAALAIGELQRMRVTRADARTGMLSAALKQLEPALAETRALEQGLQARARRLALIGAQAVPRDDAFHLLTALGEAPAAGIGLNELSYRAGRATVSGTTVGQHALAGWVAGLGRLAAFDAVEIADIERRPVRKDSALAAHAQEIGFSVQIDFAHAAAVPRAASAGFALAPARSVEGGTP
jgi:Tfp pilus assembly protein PilN